jgi:predicted lipoprotein with Yx(FWY)xxD motif
MSLCRPLFLLGVAAALALSVAACGDDDPTIGVASNGLGKILVDSRGRTIYLFEKDAGTKSACAGDCEIAWPPVSADNRPTVGSGLDEAKVGTTSRSDGDAQVTYNGHPLYLFAGDRNPGETSGQGLNAFGAQWYVASPAGGEIIGHAVGSNGGGTYGY